MTTFWDRFRRGDFDWVFEVILVLTFLATVVIMFWRPTVG